MKWLPIETAPRGPRELGRDGPSILLWSPLGGGFAHVGQWDADLSAVRPRPFFVLDLPWSRAEQRANQPTHWMPLPEPPK